MTLAVRGIPILNDATNEDARAAGLDKIVEIIDNGSDVPGTLLEHCNQEFARRLSESDLIIAKGQGNFETLCDEPRDIFFLFKVKCPVIADHAGLAVGTHVLGRSNTMNSLGAGRKSMNLNNIESMNHANLRIRVRDMRPEIRSATGHHRRTLNGMSGVRWENSSTRQRRCRFYPQRTGPCTNGAANR